jgi:phage-related minor tail protein
MKIDNNTIAIVGIIIVAITAIISAIIVNVNEIATGLVTLGSTGIGGVIGYLAKSQKNNTIADAIDRYNETTDNNEDSEKE